jgi:hypothetical protein
VSPLARELAWISFIRAQIPIMRALPHDPKVPYPNTITLGTKMSNIQMIALGFTPNLPNQNFSVSLLDTDNSIIKDKKKNTVIQPLISYHQ